MQFQHLYFDQSFYMIQNHTITSRIREELFTKTQPSINQILICLPFEPSLLRSTKFTNKDIPEKNSLLNLSTKFISFHTCFMVACFFFTTVQNVEPLNTSPRTLVTFLFRYHFKKTLPILIIKYLIL